MGNELQVMRLNIVICDDEKAIREQIFPETVIKLNKGELVIQGVIEKLNKLCKSLISSTELNRKTILYYSRNGFYRTSLIRYYLCEYEFALMKKSKSNIDKMNRWEIYEKGYNSIEHIYPENSHCRYWIDLFKEYNSKQKNALKNSFGNFVVTSSEKNGKLGNKPFPEKKSNKQNTVGSLCVGCFSLGYAMGRNDNHKTQK